MNRQKRLVDIIGMQKRADELKTLAEQRAELITQMKTMVSTSEAEKRAFNKEENTAFDELEKQVKNIDDTVNKMERAKSLEATKKEDNQDGSEATGEERARLEERAFEDYLRGKTNERAATNMTVGENGAVIPSTIAERIIKKVYDICPIYAASKHYNVTGTLTIPYYDESTQAITMAFADEFSTLESHTGKHTNITLTGFLAGALTKVSKSLVNNSKFDLVQETIDNMAETITRFVENTLINGATGKVAGLTGVTNTKTAAAATAITMDELIDLKDSVKDAFQADAMFVMSTATRTALRKLKDSTGRYYMQDDVTSQFGTTLLGKPVYTSDNMPGMEAGKTAIYYGDFSGLAIKLSEEASVQVLQEKYADEHAVGVIAWMEFDAKVENAQKIAALKMKAAI